MKPMDRRPPRIDRGLGGVIAVAALFLASDCRTVPEATSEELAIRDQWAALVPEATRQAVVEEAARHTEWGEKRKVRFEVERFEHYVHDREKKSRATRPVTHLP